MKTIQRLAVSVFVLGGLALTTGCPGLTPDITPSATPTPAAPADIVGINGRVLFNAAMPTETITLSLKKLNAGETAYEELAGVTASTVAGGYYQFDQNTAGTYKVIYRQGSNVTFATDNNTVGYLQSADITRIAADKSKAADFDLYWNVNPGVFNTAATPSSTASFTFNTKSGNYQYKVDISGGNKSAWTTVTGASASIPVIVPSSTGTKSYQILYRSVTGAEKAGGYTGESGGTPNIPFSVQ